MLNSNNIAWIRSGWSRQNSDQSSERSMWNRQISQGSVGSGWSRQTSNGSDIYDDINSPVKMIPSMPTEAIYDPLGRMLELPAHLLCCPCLYVHLSDVGQVLATCRTLRSSCDSWLLWEYHALLTGLGQPMCGDKLLADWVYPYTPEIDVERCIEWKRLLKLNVVGSGSPPAWVRVRDIDLRLPLVEGRSFVKDVATVVRLKTSNSKQKSSAASQSQQSSSSGAEFALRLRLLQWGGRPGVILGRPWGGARVVLEWTLPSDGSWPLPPHGRSEEKDTQQGVFSPWKYAREVTGSGRASSGTTGGAETRSRSRNKIRAPRLQAPRFVSWTLTGMLRTSRWGNQMVTTSSQDASEETEESSAGTQSVERDFSVRIVCSLTSRQMWVSIDSKGTVEQLYQEVERTLRAEILSLRDLNFSLELMGTGSLETPTRPLRELSWVQCETVHVVPRQSNALGRSVFMLQRKLLDNKASAALHRLALPQIVRHANCNEVEGDESSSIAASSSRWLDAATSQQRGIALRGPNPRDGDFCWLRQVSESSNNSELDLDDDMVLDRAFSRQTSAFSRQASPLESSAMSLGGFSRQVSNSEPITGGFPLAPFGLRSGAFHRQMSPQDSLGRMSPTSPLEQGWDSERMYLPEDVDRIISERSGFRQGMLPPGWEPIVPHYPIQVLPGSTNARQFEFHPTLQDTMLLGDKKGRVSILNIENPEENQAPPLTVDAHSQVLGLLWLQHHTQMAACGTAVSGRIAFLRYEPDARPGSPKIRSVRSLEAFPNLTSLSANCTDDFLLATGLSCSVTIYDMHTGQVAQQAQVVHEHFVNIGRFGNCTPHMFATASYDNTCRIWDLRTNLDSKQCIKTLCTNGKNVMCTFSSDDKYFLCSGVDTRMIQYEVSSWRKTPEHFQLRRPLYQGRYRRSMYLEDSPNIVTAATEEPYMRLMSSVTGESLGVIDISGVAQQVRQQVVNSWHPQPTPQRMSPVRYFRRHRTVPPAAAACRETPKSTQLVTGSISTEPPDILATAEGQSGRNAGPREFVQSLRAHKVVKNRVGIMLCHTDDSSAPTQSCVALVHLEPSALGWED